MSKNKKNQGKHTNNWKIERNYHRIYDQDGQVIAYIITVDGVDVEVTEEVFLVYSQMDRRERYLAEEMFAGRVLSLDQMSEDKILPRYVGAETVPDIADAYLEQEEDKRFRQRLPDAIASLDASERHLIDALYIKGISARKYGRIKGVSDMTIRKRRNRVLKKLKKILLK